MKTTRLLLLLFCSMCCINCGGAHSNNGGSSGPPPPPTYTFNILYSFPGPDGPDEHGHSPLSDLILDESGNLYGTTRNGGIADSGTVFKLSPDGSETVLHNFTGADGQYPFGGLVRDASGNFYGTTFIGGDSGNGTVYKLDSNGTQMVLHNFESLPVDGSQPLAGLVMDNAGNLYGTANFGGTGGGGIVFKVDPSGAETVVHNFGEDATGFSPWSRLLLDSAGNLYGTNLYGGGAICECGTVFKVDPAGNGTKLYAFTGNPVAGDASGPDAALPEAGLVRDPAGNLYGTTNQGGTAGLGAVFRIAPDGTELVLHSFAGGASDGAYPQQGSLLLDAEGSLYGTTGSGGNGYGTVFRLDPSGKLTLLHSFTNVDGNFPVAALGQDAAGNLYGTTEFGGIGDCRDSLGNVGGCGTVFKLSRK